MPEIARFYGLIVRMYFIKSEHVPPHIHVYYENKQGTINILTCKFITGNFPPKARKNAIKWTKLHKNELLEMWNNQTFAQIPPLD